MGGSTGKSERTGHANWFRASRRVFYFAVVGDTAQIEELEIWSARRPERLFQFARRFPPAKGGRASTPNLTAE